MPSTNPSTADKRAAAAIASELATVTTFSKVQPDHEGKARDISAAPIMGTTSDVVRFQPPLLVRKDHVEGQEGGTKDAPIIDPNTAQKAGKLVQLDEEVSVRIALPYIKSTRPLARGKLLIETQSGFKIIVSELQMDGKATIKPLCKVYESFYSAPPHEKSRAEPYYEEDHEIQEITDYGVPDLNASGFSGMVRTSVCDLLPVPATDVKVWTRGLEPTNGGTVFPSEVLPPPSTTGRVARGIPPRFSSSAQEQSNGGTVCPSEVLPPAYTTVHVMRLPYMHLTAQEAALVLRRGKSSTS